MKNGQKVLMLLSAVVMLWGAGQKVSASVIYQDVFTAGDVDRAMSFVGWEAREGTNGANWTYPKIAHSGGTTLDEGSVNSNPQIPDSATVHGGYWYIYAHANKASFFLTNEYSFDMGAYSDLQFSMRHNSNTAEVVRAAIEVDDNWYVSDGVALVDHAGWAGAKMWHVDADTTNWYVLNYVPGTTMNVGGATTLPSSGTVGGFGWYIDAVGSARSIRYDNYKIVGNPVPEPATVVLLSLGAWASLRRRRS